MRLITFLGVVDVPCEIVIYSDNKAVVDGYNSGPREGHGNMDDLWEQYWAIHSIIAPQGWHIDVGKIKAHTP